MQIGAEFGRAYDQAKREKGYADDSNNVGANRHLTNWYLTKKTEPDIDPDGSDAELDHDPLEEKKRALSVHRRVPLPLKTQSLNGYVLYGDLEPSTSNDEGRARAGQTVKVVITKPSTWVFDRTKSNRGIWVTTGISRGWYRLKQPNTDPVELDTTITLKKSGQPESPSRKASLPSQETVHLPLRARLGLLSNLVDLLSEPYGGGSSTDNGDAAGKDEDGITHNYVPIHAKRTPEAIHALLSPSEEIWKEHNTPEQPLNSEPFDLELLKECPGFVRRHLDAMHALLDADCLFMSSLTEMDKARTDAGKDRPAEGAYGDDDVGWSDESYRTSAESAEARGRRTPWGDIIPGEEGKVRPNRLIDIEIQRAARMANEAVDDEHVDAEEEAEDYGDDDDSDEEDVGAQPWKRKAATAAASSSLGKKRVVAEDDDSDDDGSGDKANKKKSKLSYDDNLREKQLGANSIAADDITAIPGVASDFDPLDYLAAEPGAELSPDAIAAAVKTLSKFLSPEPSDDDMSAATYSSGDVPTKFALSEDQVSAFIGDFVHRPNIPSLESILLATETIRRSEKKVMKMMFKIIKAHSQVAGKIVFDKWLDTAILLVGRSKACSTLIMSSIMNLICDFSVIKDAQAAWSAQVQVWTWIGWQVSKRLALAQKSMLWRPFRLHVAELGTTSTV